MHLESFDTMTYLEDIGLSSTMIEIFLVLAALMVIETMVVFILALHRHANNLTHPLMQRACTSGL